MNEYPNQENKKMFFLLSLLLHIALLMICLLFLSYHKSPDTAPIKETDILPDNLSRPDPRELAQMKAKQSAFGAPVVFAEIPESIERLAAQDEKEVNGLVDNIDGQDDHTNTLSRFSDGQEGTPRDTPDQEALSLAQEHADQTHMVVDQSHAANPIPVAGKTTEIGDEKKIPVQKIASIENTGLRKRKQQINIPGDVRQLSMRKKATATTGQGDSKRSAAPVSKKFTFADLAHGFMENLQAGGQDAINQRGNPNKRPGIEQLKQASYKQKMAWSLQAAFKRAARRTKFLIPSPEQNRLACTFYISKEGVLEKLDIISSTGHQELDSYIITTIKDAFPLPPIPDHWAQEMLVQSWVFSNIQPDASSYTVNF